MLQQPIVIINKLGLHARASAKFVALASQFKSKIEIKRADKLINGKSILGLMMLAASKGTELELIIEGEDEQEALEALVELIKSKFGEEH